MAHPVRYLSRKCKHLHLGPLHPVKNPGVGEDVCHNNSLERDKREPWSSQTSQLGQLEDPEVQRETGKIHVEVQERHQN